MVEGEEIPAVRNLADVTPDTSKKVWSVKIPETDVLDNGTKYRFTIDGVVRDYTVRLGVPNKLEVVWECLGDEKKAYTYDENLDLDVPVTLSYRLYYGNVDLTDTYAEKGSITYEFVNEKDEYSDKYQLDGDTLTFYTNNASTTIRAIYSYYESSDDDEPKEIKATANIRSEKLPKYEIRNTIKYTIIDENDALNAAKAINWSKTTNEVVANADGRGATLVIMVEDSYGNYYVNDERGVNHEKKIYWMEDPDTLFYQLGYSVEFELAGTQPIIVGEDGFVLPYEKTTATALVYLKNDGTAQSENYKKSLMPCSIKVLAAAKLNKLSLEEDNITLSADALPEYKERFCEDDVKLTLLDQYGKEWTNLDDVDFDITCTNAKVNNAIDIDSASSPIKMDGTTLHISVANILEATGGSVGNYTFTIKETNTKLSTKLTVKVQNPYTKDEIKVSGFDLEAEHDSFVIGAEDMDSNLVTNTIEVFQTAGGSKAKVGLYENLYIIENTNSSSFEGGSVNDIYLLVKGADGKTMEEVSDSELGVYIDRENGCLKMNVAVPDGNNKGFTYLPAGTYKITAYRITDVKDNGTVVKSSPSTVSFTVTDATKKVEFRSVKSATTSLYGLEEIVVNAFTFKLDGEEWTDLTADMVVDVDYIENGSHMIIRKVTFAVPVDSANPSGPAYLKTCEVNRNVTKKD